jgi:hypothetical protein
MQMIAVTDSEIEGAARANSRTVNGAQRLLVALANEDLDEALWAPVPQFDKIALTEALLCRYIHQRRDNRQRMRGARDG